MPSRNKKNKKKKKKKKLKNKIQKHDKIQNNLMKTPPKAFLDSKKLKNGKTLIQIKIENDELDEFIDRKIIIPWPKPVGCIPKDMCQEDLLQKLFYIYEGKFKDLIENLKGDNVHNIPDFLEKDKTGKKIILSDEFKKNALLVTAIRIVFTTIPLHFVHRLWKMIKKYLYETKKETNFKKRTPFVQNFLRLNSTFIFILSSNYTAEHVCDVINGLCDCATSSVRLVYSLADVDYVEYVVNKKMDLTKEVALDSSRPYTIQNHEALAKKNLSPDVFDVLEKNPEANILYMKRVTCYVCEESVVYKNLLYCDACCIVPYCSRKCQKRDWRFHKKKCKKLKNGTLRRELHYRNTEFKKCHGSIMRLRLQGCEEKLSLLHDDHKDRYYVEIVGKEQEWHTTKNENIPFTPFEEEEFLQQIFLEKMKSFHYVNMPRQNRN